MTKKRQILFSVIRGLLAILIALLVATLLIFLSADGDSFAEKLAATGGALKQLLVGPHALLVGLHRGEILGLCPVLCKVQFIKRHLSVPP